MKVSIITVAYESEKTIGDAIESVLNQTYPDIEYIIVDGSSKDGTISIIKKYESQFNGRMHWISEPDEGIYYAMNKGIFLSSGDLIGLLNSDDLYIDSNAVSKIVSKIKNDNADCCYANVMRVDINDTNKVIRIARNPFVNGHVLYNKRISKHNLEFEMTYRGWHPNHPTFFIKKEFYEKYGLFNTKYRIEADFDLMFRFIVIKNAKLTFLDSNILKMRAVVL